MSFVSTHGRLLSSLIPESCKIILFCVFFILLLNSASSKTVKMPMGDSKAISIIPLINLKIFAPMALSRKEQIFAKTKSVGGKRKAVSEMKQSTGIKYVLENKFNKGELAPTMIESVSFQVGENIHSLKKVNVKSIMKDRRKQIGFIAQGQEVVEREEDVLNNLPEDLLSKLAKKGEKVEK